MLTKTTEEDVINHFKKLETIYEERYNEYYDKLQNEIRMLETKNPYSSHDWRKESPQKIFEKQLWFASSASENEELFERYFWLHHVRSDLRLCDLSFKWSNSTNEELASWFSQFEFMTECRTSNLIEGGKCLKNLDLLK